MDKPLIQVFGANPSWQKTLFFDKFVPFAVNRASRVELYAGGKGVNFCRAAACRGAAATRLYHFSGGGNGARHEAALREEGIGFCAVHVEAETRSCTTCLDAAGSAMTELIEPAHAVSAAKADEMVELFDAGLAGAYGAAITGSLPDGTDPELYTRIAEVVLGRGLPLLADAVHAGMLDRLGGMILKINLDELKRLVGDGEALSVLRAGAARWPEATLAITDGANHAYLAAKGRIWRYELPPIKVVSALGAGDTCSAVMLSEFLTGKDAVAAFACGIAAASANCLTPRAGEFSNAECAKLMPVVSEL